MTVTDLARYQAACTRWEQEKDHLPYPKSEIPDGQETHRLLEHHYRYWHQMFNPRQLLCLATLLQAIDEEPDQTLKEMLLSAFQMCLEANNIFARYRTDSGGRSPFGGIFARHDFQPKLTPCEINVWGPYAYYGVYEACFGKVLRGKEFNFRPFDYRALGHKREAVSSGEYILGRKAENVNFESTSSLRLSNRDKTVDFVITDPPYGGNVNYAELTDFFYVWLRLILAKQYPEFTPELTPKAEEIIENPTRGKTKEDFEEGLRQVFRECYRVLKDDGLLAFTFHHAEGGTWESLLRSVCNAGFEIESVYPIHGEAESSLHLLDKEGAISYDLIHVCKKRPAAVASDAVASPQPPAPSPQLRSWAGIRQEIRRRAREEIKSIEAGRYGNEPLSPADVNIILIGKCLELYSRHYGAVVDHEGNPFELKDALKEIRNLVDQLVTKDRPLPGELEDLDAESRIYLLTLCDRKEIKSDEVHKATRGILEPEDLIEAGLMVRGRAGRGRTYEVKQPSERFQQLLEKFTREPSAAQATLFPSELPKRKGRVLFIDYVHLLMALAEGGENLLPWLERFRGEAPRIRAACEYLASRNKAFAPTLKKILSLLDVGPLFR